MIRTFRLLAVRTPVGKLLLLTFAALLLATLAACGGSEPATPTPTEAAAVAAVEAPAPAPVVQASDVVATAPTPAAIPLGEKPEYGGTMSEGRNSLNGSLDTYHLAGGRGQWGNLYQNSLVQVFYPYDSSKGVEYEGGLATEWTLSADGTKWTFKLRPGVTWHDGEVFNADDVVATVERLLDKDLSISPPLVQMRNEFKGMRKVDDYTVVLDTGTPKSTAFSWFASVLLIIAPSHLIKGDPASPDPNVRWKFMGPDPVKQTGTLAVGTGPFIMKKWDPQVESIGERNPNYWKKDRNGNPLPYLDRVVHRVIPDGTRLLANFVGGELSYSGGQSATGIHPGKAKLLCTQTRDKQCYTVPGPHGNFGATLNHVSTPVFQDKRVAAATRYSMDMQEIFRKTYGGYLGFTWMDRVSYSDTALPIKEQYELIPWSDPSRRPEFVQKAKDLLTEAGYPDGVDLNYPLFGSCAGVFLEQWSYISDDMYKAGIRNFLECRQGIVGNAEQRAGRFSVGGNNISQYKIDPGHMISITAMLDSPAVGGLPWRWGPNQEQIDKLYRDAVRTLDVSQRNEKYRNMERFMADPSFTVIPVGYSTVAFALHGCVRDFRPGGTWDSSNYAWERTWLTKECR